jgi:hypothetical protein
MSKKLPEVTTAFTMRVCLPVRPPKKTKPQRTDFNEILYVEFLLMSVYGIQDLLKLGKSIIQFT